MASSMAARKEHLCMAKLAEETGRYDDMMNSITKLVSEIPDTEGLTEEEFNLMGTSYRKVMEPLRAAWRRVKNIEEKEELRGTHEHAKMAEETRCRIESEISEICYKMVKMLDEKLLAGAKCLSHAKVVLLKMRGDYYRYLAEVKDGDERKEAAECALEAYQSAKDIADAELTPIHLTRLGLAVNFSVFYYDVLNQHERACTYAKQAVDEAISELTKVDEDSYKDKEDITLVLRVLKENLKLWKSDMQSKARDELHVVRSTTTADKGITADKGRERRRPLNERYTPSICPVQE